MFCGSLCVPLYLFLLTILLSVLLRITNSDYPFGIFKLFCSNKYCINGENKLQIINNESNMLNGLGPWTDVKKGR